MIPHGKVRAAYQDYLFRQNGNITTVFDSSTGEKMGEIPAGNSFISVGRQGIAMFTYNGGQTGPNWRIFSWKCLLGRPHDLHAGEGGRLYAVYPGVLFIFHEDDLSTPLGKVFFEYKPRHTSLQVRSAGTSRAFVGETEGLTVVDVSDAAQPRVVGKFSGLGAPYRSVRRLQVVGDTLYFSSFYCLASLPVSSPVGSSAKCLGVDGGEFVVLGGHAYLTTAEGLTVVDLSTGTRVGELKGDYLGGTVVGQGNIVFVGTRDRVVSVLVCDPTNPEVLSVVVTRAPNQYLRLSGDRLYGVSGDQGVFEIDVSNPRALRRVGEFRKPYPVVVVEATAKKVYYAGKTQFTSEGEVPAPGRARCFSGPKWKFSLYPEVCEERAEGVCRMVHPSSRPVDVRAWEGHVFVLHKQGLYVYAEEGPLSSTVGEVAMRDDVYGVEIGGGRAFIPGAGGLTVVDVRDPKFPRVEGKFNDGTLLLRATVSGGKVYFLGSRCLVSLPVSAPVGSEAPCHPTEGYNLAVLGEHVFVSGEHQLQVLNSSSWEKVGDLRSPVLPRLAYGIAARGDVLFLGGPDKVVSVLVCDPARPVVLSSVTTKAVTYFLSLAGDRLYGVAGAKGLFEIDVSDPADLRQVEGFRRANAVAPEATSTTLYASLADGRLVNAGAVPEGNPQCLDGVAGKFSTYSGVCEEAEEGVCQLVPPSSSPNDIQAHLGYVFVLYDLQLFVYLETNLSAPVSGVYLKKGGVELALSGKRGFVAGIWGLTVLDLSDPGRPVIAGEFRANNQRVGFHNAVVSEGSVYFHGNCMGVLPVSSPVGKEIECINSSDTGHLTVLKGHVFVASQSLQVWDFATGKVVGETNLSAGGVVDVAVRGDVLFVLGMERLVAVLVCDPTSPVVLSTLPLGEGKYHRQMSLSNDRVYVVSFAREVLEIDVSDPLSMKRVGGVVQNGVDALLATATTLYFASKGRVTKGGAVPAGAKRCLTRPEGRFSTNAGGCEEVEASTGERLAGTCVARREAVGALDKIPADWGTAKVYVPKSTLPAGAQLSLRCAEACEVFVTVHHCPPCTGKTNGGLPKLLPTANWEAGVCAPLWDGTKRMTSFRTELAGGGAVVLPPTDAPLERVAVFVVPLNTSCPAITDKSSCKEAGPCTWRGSACVREWCPLKKACAQPSSPCECT
eukprot:Sspe_Gene.35296::Locus_17113_Transcript_1_1_Confidence_1.000_Length_4456::g.35296::m.35296